MSKAKQSAAASSKPAIVTHAGPLLQEQGIAEETVKEPILTAPVLPIETLDEKPSAKDKPAAKAAKKSAAPDKPETKPAEPVAEEDSSHIIQVKRLTVKPLSEAALAETEPTAEPEPATQAAPTESKPETESQVQPLVDKSADTEETVPQPESKEPEPDTPPAPAAEPPQEEASPGEAPAPETTGQPQPKPVDPEAEAKQQAEHDAAIQKLVDGKKYLLPINAVEKRRSKRFVAVGVLLSLLLLLAWADIALDASLVTVPGIEPVTHFFSN